jgi:hypothetical protein
MESIRIWGLRLIAAVLGAAGTALALVAVESDWSSVRFVSTPIEHSGIAAAAFSLFLIGCSMVALVASSPRRKYSARARLITALLAVIGIGALALRYASRAA